MGNYWIVTSHKFFQHKTSAKKFSVVRCKTAATSAGSRLKAAAPDLLAELRHLTEAYVSEYGEDCPASIRARAAIAKATGAA